jgi:hypothetical protein
MNLYQANYQLKSCIIVLFLLLCISFNSYAQEKKYVEVMATEHVMLNPVSFEYAISLGVEMPYPPPMSQGYDQVEEEETPEVKPTMMDIESLLKNNKFTYKMSADKDYSISTYQVSKESVVVTLNSLEELEKLYNSLQSLKGINGKISDIKFEDPEKYKGTLYKGLYDKAHSQATLIASLSKNTIGSLLSVEEVKGTQDYLTELFESIGSMARELPFMNMFSMSNFQKNYEKKLLFKFALN